jgi:hypothetical protein
MGTLQAPRFVGDPVLQKCLDGTPIISGNTTKEGHVSRLQQALNDADCEPLLVVDGLFGSNTSDAVRDYKAKNGLKPADSDVDSSMMAHLDTRYTLEIVQQAAAQAPVDFHVGAMQSSEPGEGSSSSVSIYPFKSGTVLLIGGTAAKFLHSLVDEVWQATRKVANVIVNQVADVVPLSDLTPLAANLWLQEFTKFTILFNPKDDGSAFSIPRDFWEASIAGRDMIGLPKLGSGYEPFGSDGAMIVKHEHGVVLGYKDMIPQPLPQSAFDEWAKRQTTAKPLGPPAGFAFTGSDGVHPVFTFIKGQLPDDGSGWNL